jgi:hypothetical protein
MNQSFMSSSPSLYARNIDGSSSNTHAEKALGDRREGCSNPTTMQGPERELSPRMVVAVGTTVVAMGHYPEPESQVLGRVGPFQACLSCRCHGAYSC